jgi:hypothetical protein
MATQQNVSAPFHPPNAENIDPLTGMAAPSIKSSEAANKAKRTPLADVTQLFYSSQVK